MSSKLARVALALCGVLLATACVRMPSEGPVTEVRTDGSPSPTPGIYFDPKPPQPGESATEIVANFLEAMKATPSRTSVASEFLTADAQQRWTPESSIITYGELGDPAGEQEVAMPLIGIEKYDARGAWQRSHQAVVVTFELTTEDGEWRIDDLPDALIVPETWFEDWFRRVSLYFFDPTARILVPEPVFVPEGDQLASSLVRGLLDDPTSDPRITRTFVPPDFTSGVSVPITAAGIAEVSLMGDASAVDEETSQRILTQLIWTMRQEQRIRAVRLTIGDEEQGLPGGATQVDLDVGDAFDPTGAQSSGDLFGLVEGRVVRGSVGSLLPTAGPMGSERLGVRSIGVDLAGERVAGVSGDGRSLLVAPVDVEGTAVEVASGARDLLPPAWDFADRIWLADRAAGGAVISVVVGQQPPRSIDVPGVSGRDIRHLLISRDGSRLVAVVRTPNGDRIVASRILHSDAGRVLRATRAVVLD
ncbi:MAG: LpqB family beta-propeller domain-containing protein, partial [Nocardioides sp.]